MRTSPIKLTGVTNASLKNDCCEGCLTRLLFTYASTLTYIHVCTHEHRKPLLPFRGNSRVQSCPEACLHEENVCSSNQSDVAHSNLSLLRMSLFAIFSQLRPNILYHSTAGSLSFCRRAYTHALAVSSHTSTVCRYPLKEPVMCVFQIGVEKALD